jgi:LmbE family N-acetylglucosaminyl deacetylase
MKDLGTVLGVWAHPDDETYLMGGLMASLVQNGGRVVCVTATRGEAGSQDEVRWPSETIGQVREQELDDALGILGVEEHHWLDYIDGRCTEVDDAEAAAKIAAIIEDVGPDSVLTFDPDGHTGHPDHVCVSRWTSSAFERAAKPGAHLYHVAVAHEWLEKWGPVLEPYNVFAPGTPLAVAREDLAISFHVTGEFLEMKMKALRAQPSQTEGLIAALGETFFRDGLLEETFAVVATK